MSRHPDTVVEAMAEDFYDRVRPAGSLSFAAHGPRLRAQIIAATRSCLAVAGQHGWILTPIQQEADHGC